MVGSSLAVMYGRDRFGRIVFTVVVLMSCCGRYMYTASAVLVNFTPEELREREMLVRALDDEIAELSHAVADAS